MKNPVGFLPAYEMMLRNLSWLALSAYSVYADNFVSLFGVYADNCLSAYSVYADKKLSAYTLYADNKIALFFYPHIVKYINILSD